MLARAESIKERKNASNTSFIESPITKINLPDAAANCIISNCVVNLIPTREKQSAFHEMYRLLKPNGRIAISDILLKQDLPHELKSNMELYVGCIAGASRIEEYESYLAEAGFTGPMYRLGNFIVLQADPGDGCRYPNRRRSE